MDFSHPLEAIYHLFPGPPYAQELVELAGDWVGGRAIILLSRSLRIVC